MMDFPGWKSESNKFGISLEEFTKTTSATRWRTSDLTAAAESFFFQWD